jgi:hypothetical protein
MFTLRLSRVKKKEVIAMGLQERQPTGDEIAAAVELLRTYAPSVLASGLMAYSDPSPTPARCDPGGSMGLAPWQLKRAKTLLESHLCGGIGIMDVVPSENLIRGFCGGKQNRTMIRCDGGPRKPSVGIHLELLAIA